MQSVHIDGVLHEFSSIAGVREDVTDIVLNIKDISIKMQGEGPKRMVVKKQGPGAVAAGDIQTVGDVVVLNPELQICTLDEGAEIRMEFTVAAGKGYVAAERNRPEDAPIGLIPVDSLFSPGKGYDAAERNRPEDAPIGLIPVDSLYSPVRKVSYKVENTREGQILDVVRRPVRHFHAEVQTHAGQHLLDLVQRLAAEIRGAEHLRLGLLDEVADIDDVVVLQAVGRAHRKLEFVDRDVDAKGKDSGPVAETEAEAA